MKIHKALKVKNRLAGEISKLQEILKRENSRRSDNPSTVNCEEIYKNYQDVAGKLIQIKSSISRASAGIASSLSKLSECKNQLNYLNSLPTRRGVEAVFIGRDQEKLEYTWDTFLSREDIDKLTSELQLAINNLQDEIDNYNSSTDVDYLE